MIASYGANKTFRMLDLFEKFSRGSLINKQQIAAYYHVTEKSIQRDIADLNEYFSLQSNSDCKILYSPKEKGYRLLNRSNAFLSDSDIFALIKVLLESRAFSATEMKRIISTFLNQCNDKESIKKAVQNELCYYVPPRHGKDIIDFIWKIASSIHHSQYAVVTYQRQDGITKEHRLKPLGLIFSEYYFYLVAEICDLEKDQPAVFRVDRFQSYCATEEHFNISYKDRFEESEFHKRIHFMYPGQLIHLQFKFWGGSLEAVLDRIPTARVVGYDGEKAIIEAEVYDRGIIMWLLSQMEFLEVTKPKSLRIKMANTIKKMGKLYEENST
ncbi:MAG: putative DNA-binding transcriptional regulator YafY, contains an HTH and WYL domains [Oscillospiraceae bacterium]|jgi:predicted DNA-binding transcriptional regulator YafY